MKYEIGIKVNVKNKDGEKPGIIEGCVPGLPIYIVKVEDRLIKVRETDIELLQDPDTITISREEFRSLAIGLTNPKNFEDEVESLSLATMIGLSGALICARMERELFGD